MKVNYMKKLKYKKEIFVIKIIFQKLNISINL